MPPKARPKMSARGENLPGKRRRSESSSEPLYPDPLAVEFPPPPPPRPPVYPTQPPSPPPVFHNPPSPPPAYQNPPPSSSSVPPTPDTERLLTARETRDKRKLLLQGRKFIPGRYVDSTQIPKKYGIDGPFTSIGLRSLLFFKPDLGFKPELVTEFYAGFEFYPSEDRITLQFFDSFHTWTLSEFGAILDLPSEGPRIYAPENQVSTLDNFEGYESHVCLPPLLRPGVDPSSITVLNDDKIKDQFRVWQKVLISDVFPKSGEAEKVSAQNIFIMYCTIKGIKFNATYMVCNRMANIPESKRNMPYCALLNRLFRHLGYELSSLSSLDAPINWSSVDRMFSKKRTKSGPGQSSGQPASQPSGSGVGSQAQGQPHEIEEEDEDEISDGSYTPVYTVKGAIQHADRLHKQQMREIKKTRSEFKKGIDDLKKFISDMFGCRRTDAARPSRSL